MKRKKERNLLLFKFVVKKKWELFNFFIFSSINIEYSTLQIELNDIIAGQIQYFETNTIGKRGEKEEYIEKKKIGKEVKEFMRLRYKSSTNVIFFLIFIFFIKNEKIKIKEWDKVEVWDEIWIFYVKKRRCRRKKKELKRKKRKKMCRTYSRKKTKKKK